MAGTAPFAAALAAGLLLTGCGDGTEAPGSVGHGVVETVVDGDTLHLRDGRRIRLVQIDAPEERTECYGREATRVLAAVAPPGTRVALVSDPALDDVDRSGRLLRYVEVGRTNVNVRLVAEGAASPYFFRGARGRHADGLVAAAKDARRARRGFWGACPLARLDPGRGVRTGPR